MRGEESGADEREAERPSCSPIVESRKRASAQARSPTGSCSSTPTRNAGVVSSIGRPPSCTSRSTCSWSTNVVTAMAPKNTGFGASKRLPAPPSASPRSEAIRRICGTCWRYEWNASAGVDVRRYASVCATSTPAARTGDTTSHARVRFTPSWYAQDRAGRASGCQERASAARATGAQRTENCGLSESARAYQARIAARSPAQPSA